MGSFVLLFHLPKKKNVFGRWHVAWKGPFRVMKKLNESNYVVQRSIRSRSFVVHGDRLKHYHGKVEDGTWPAALLDAAQGAPDADQPSDPDSDGQQQQSARHRRPGRSRGRPQMAESQEKDSRKRDHIAKFPASSATSTAQQQAASTASVPPANTLTYSDEPSRGQRQPDLILVQSEAQLLDVRDASVGRQRSCES